MTGWPSQIANRLAIRKWRIFAHAKTLLFVALLASFVAQLLSGYINPYYLDVTVGVGINIILAVSLNLINGFTGQFSLGHAGFMAVGAYTSAAVSIFLGPRFLSALGNGNVAVSVLFFLALLIGGVIAAVVGILVGAPSLRLKGDYLAIVTLGFGEIIRVVFRNIPSLGGALGLNGIPAYTNLFWVFSSAALTIYTVTALVNSTFGRGFLAVHDNEVAAEAMGLNPTKYKMVAFVVGAFFAGIAGGLYGHYKMSIDPRGFGFLKSIEIVVMVILGGMGNTIGVIIGAIVITLLPEVLRGNLEDYRMIIYSLLLIILMLMRPQGLFTPRKRALAERKTT